MESGSGRFWTLDVSQLLQSIPHRCPPPPPPPSERIVVPHNPTASRLYLPRSARTLFLAFGHDVLRGDRLQDNDASSPPCAQSEPIISLLRDDFRIAEGGSSEHNTGGLSMIKEMHATPSTTSSSSTTTVTRTARDPSTPENNNNNRFSLARPGTRFIQLLVHVEMSDARRLRFFDFGGVADHHHHHHSKIEEHCSTSSMPPASLTSWCSPSLQSNISWLVPFGGGSSSYLTADDCGRLYLYDARWNGSSTSSSSPDEKMETRKKLHRVEAVQSPLLSSSVASKTSQHVQPAECGSLTEVCVVPTDGTTTEVYGHAGWCGGVFLSPSSPPETRRNEVGGAGRSESTLLAVAREYVKDVRVMVLQGGGGGGGGGGHPTNTVEAVTLRSYFPTHSISGIASHLRPSGYTAPCLPMHPNAEDSVATTSSFEAYPTASLFTVAAGPYLQTFDPRVSRCIQHCSTGGVGSAMGAHGGLGSGHFWDILQGFEPYHLVTSHSDRSVCCYDFRKIGGGGGSSSSSSPPKLVHHPNVLKHDVRGIALLPAAPAAAGDRRRHGEGGAIARSSPRLVCTGIDAEIRVITLFPEKKSGSGGASKLKGTNCGMERGPPSPHSKPQHTSPKIVQLGSATSRMDAAINPLPLPSSSSSSSLQIGGTFRSRIATSLNCSTTWLGAPVTVMHHAAPSHSGGGGGSVPIVVAQSDCGEIFLIE